MTFDEVINKRKSTRNFSNKSVELEKLIRICETARLAPSSCNSQPWIMHIVTEQSKEINELRKACQFFGLNKFLNNVNNFIVVEQDYGNLTVKVGSSFTKNDLNSIDLGILASYIVLKAADEGLGTCIIGGFRKETILKAMNFSDKQTIRFVIAIGYENEQEEKTSKTKRKKVEDVIKIH